MYIDKIYTKLYSDKNWDGLNQLVNEIKSFARKDYEGLNSAGKEELKRQRDRIAKEVRKYRKWNDEDPKNSIGRHFDLTDDKRDALKHARGEHNYLELRKVGLGDMHHQEWNKYKRFEDLYRQGKLIKDSESDFGRYAKYENYPTRDYTIMVPKNYYR